MSNKKQLLINFLKVTSHWVAATLLVGIVLLIKQDPTVIQKFTGFLVEFGVPMYLANIITAGGVKMLQLKASSLQE